MLSSFLCRQYEPDSSHRMKKLVANPATIVSREMLGREVWLENMGHSINLAAIPHQVFQYFVFFCCQLKEPVTTSRLACYQVDPKIVELQNDGKGLLFSAHEHASVGQFRARACIYTDSPSRMDDPPRNYSVDDNFIDTVAHTVMALSHCM